MSYRHCNCRGCQCRGWTKKHHWCFACDKLGVVDDDGVCGPCAPKERQIREDRRSLPVAYAYAGMSEYYAKPNFVRASKQKY